MKLVNKKYLLILAAPLLIVGCGEGTTTDTYAKINNAINKKYSAFNLAIETSDDDKNLKLTSTYQFSLSGNVYTVKTRIESYATISMDTNVPQKTVTENTVEQEASQVSFAKFVVNTSTYANIQYSESGTFSATFADAKKFLNYEDGVSDAAIVITFGENLKSIAYSYDTSASHTNVVFDSFVA